jgi:uncharacterized protein
MVTDTIKADFLFNSQQDEKFNFDDDELVELKPYGLSLTNENARPFLILKDALGEHTLPVAVTQIEAGVALSQSSPTQMTTTPHAFLDKLLSSLDIKIERCVFIEITGNHQYVRIFMTGHPRYQSIKVRADEAMSLCLHLKVPFYATKSFIQKSKVMSTNSMDETAHIVMQQRAVSVKKELLH